MITDYSQACEQLARVAATMGEYATITPSADGYRAAIANHSGRGTTPTEAARYLCRLMANALHVHHGARLTNARAREVRHNLIDALAEAFEALGGDWRAALWRVSKITQLRRSSP